MNTTKAIIFDADGMIITGERFSSRLDKDYGISPESTHNFFEKEFQECLIGKSDLKETLSIYLEQWNWKGSTEDFLDYWFSDKYNMIDERFVPVIDRLRDQGIKVYLATNNERYRTDNLIEDRRLGKWFDYVFSSAYIGSKKPNAVFFQAILDKTGYKKEETMFWDDDPENIKAAMKFGLSVGLYEGFDKFMEKMSILIEQKKL